MTSVRSLNELATDEIIVAPSILAADFSRMGDELAHCVRGGAKVLHIDVMDGHFVPNLSFGPGVVKALRPHSDICFDSHLMITDPLKYIEPFARAGSDNITIHVEVKDDITAALKMIHDLGCTAGLSLKPGTPAEALAPYIDKVELILLMTVEPGFGGQSFMADQLPKARQIRDMILTSGKRVHLQADGGIDTTNYRQCIDAGINILVAGSSIFKSPKGPEQATRDLLT